MTFAQTVTGKWSTKNRFHTVPADIICELRALEKEIFQRSHQLEEMLWMKN